MKLKEVFEKTVRFFKDKQIETARLDAEILIAHALKTDRLNIYLKYEQPLNEDEIQVCRELVRRRGLGEPVAYLVKEKGFYGEVFSVGPGVLIPRPETEMIVEEALSFIKEQSFMSPRILDLGAGTGCIGFSILKNCESATLVSVEKSNEAFSYLKANQKKLGLDERSQLIQDDVMSVTVDSPSFDVIIANPPYIAENDPQTEANVKKYEPSMALFSEQNGLGALYGWSEKFKGYLGAPGLMMFEMGYLQGESVKNHFESFKQFSEIKILKDLSGLDRFVKATQ